jgi:hypothetical protein
MQPITRKTRDILNSISAKMGGPGLGSGSGSFTTHPGSLKAPPFLYSAIPEQYRREMEANGAATTTTATMSFAAAEAADTAES